MSDWQEVYDLLISRCEHYKDWHSKGAAALRFLNEKESRITRLESDVATLREQLAVMTKHYVQLAGSGDCGFWDPEEEQEVIDAREALSRISGEDRHG